MIEFFCENRKRLEVFIIINYFCEKALSFFLYSGNTCLGTIKLGKWKRGQGFNFVLVQLENHGVKLDNFLVDLS